MGGLYTVWVCCECLISLSCSVPGSSGNLYNCQRHNNSLAVYGRNSSTSIATSAVGIAMLFFTVAYMWWVDPTPFPSPLLFPLLSALPSLCFFPSPPVFIPVSYSFSLSGHRQIRKLQGKRATGDDSDDEVRVHATCTCTCTCFIVCLILLRCYRVCWVNVSTWPVSTDLIRRLISYYL